MGNAPELAVLVGGEVGGNRRLAGTSRGACRGRTLRRRLRRLPQPPSGQRQASPPQLRQAANLALAVAEGDKARADDEVDVAADAEELAHEKFREAGERGFTNQGDCAAVAVSREGPSNSTTARLMTGCGP
jgi:hypothetical protein